MPIGKRPKPKVAGGGKNPGKTDTGKSYSGKSGSKSPRGARPTPSVAHNTPSPGKVPGKVKAPIKHTRMPTPLANATRSTGNRQTGG